MPIYRVFLGTEPGQSDCESFPDEHLELVFLLGSVSTQISHSSLCPSPKNPLLHPSIP